MNQHDARERMTEAEEREWLAQERALREERNRVAGDGDATVAAYRDVVRALRVPPPDAPPADFARTVAAACGRQHARADTRLEQQVQRVLLAVLAVAALAACAIYGDDWLRASQAALPLLDRGTTLNWSAALAACLGLSWAMDALRRRVPVR